MTWHDASHTGVSIFLNKQNLIFSLPLISVCTIYAYFKFIPLHLALSIVGAAIVIYKISASLKQRAIEKKEERIANLDESFLQELAADEIQQEKLEQQKLKKKKLKAENKARQRIASEKKKKGGDSSGRSKDDDEDEDEDDVSTFVKGSRGKKKRN